MRKKFVISFAGDTSLGEWYMRKPGKEELINRLDSNPFSFFKGVKPIVEGSDYFILNFESVLADNPTAQLEDKEYPNWDHPMRMLDVLNKLGVTSVGLTNNHSMDFGPEVMLSTKKQLETAGVKVFGAGDNVIEAAKPLKMELVGTSSTKNIYVLTGMRAERRYREKYNFFANEEKPGINSLSKNAMSREISNLRKNDPKAIIIVYPHWQGLDYKWASEISGVQGNCRAFIDAGADYVFGHGPHMLNDIEKYKNGTIAYSIGNFVFNSPGRYKKLNAPPYSLIVKLEIIEDYGSWSVVPYFYPVVTDNRSTNYIVKTLRGNLASELNAVLNERAKTNGMKVIYSLAKDEIGPYFTIESGKDNYIFENSEVLEIITHKKDISTVDFNDPALVKRHLSELRIVHQKLDSAFKNYYSNLLRGKVVRNNEFKSLAKLSEIVKKNYMNHYMVRKFERGKLNINNAFSFSEIMIENSQLRRLGFSENSWKLDEKTNAYKFSDNIGLRRPKTLLGPYKFSEVQKPDSPAVIKPVKATGSMGVYLVFNENTILSAREGVYMSSWDEMEKDAKKKLEDGKIGKNPLLTTDKWITEELVLSAKGSTIPPNDLKFYCFYGEVLLVLEANRAHYGEYCFWDSEMNLAKTGKYDGRNQFYEHGLGFTKEDMDLVVSASLQIPAPFIRLDMLKGHDGLVFGEATPRPGRFHMFNDEYDSKLGEAYRRAEARILRDLLNGKKFEAFTELFEI